MRTAYVPHPMALAGTRRPPRQAWVAARLRARLGASWIDRRLAAGAVSWCSPVYAARAVQLTGNRSRFALARSLERLLERAEEPPALFKNAAVPPCGIQVRDALPVILELASRLRSGAPVDARGVAQLSELLSDGAGPCYRRIHPEALTRALERVSRALDVDD
jgi:hypothetical protein